MSVLSHGGLVERLFVFLGLKIAPIDREREGFFFSFFFLEMKKKKKERKNIEEERRRRGKKRVERGRKKRKKESVQWYMIRLWGRIWVTKIIKKR